MVRGSRVVAAVNGINSIHDRLAELRRGLKTGGALALPATAALAWVGQSGDGLTIAEAGPEDEAKPTPAAGQVWRCSSEMCSNEHAIKRVDPDGVAWFTDADAHYGHFLTQHAECIGLVMPNGDRVMVGEVWLMDCADGRTLEHRVERVYGDGENCVSFAGTGGAASERTWGMLKMRKAGATREARQHGIERRDGEAPNFSDTRSAELKAHGRRLGEPPPHTTAWYEHHARRLLGCTVEVSSPRAGETCIRAMGAVTREAITAMQRWLNAEAPASVYVVVEPPVTPTKPPTPCALPSAPPSAGYCCDGALSLRSGASLVALAHHYGWTVPRGATDEIVRDGVRAGKERAQRPSIYSYVKADLDRRRLSMSVPEPGSLYTGGDAMPTCASGRAGAAPRARFGDVEISLPDGSPFPDGAARYKVTGAIRQEGAEVLRGYDRPCSHPLYLPGLAQFDAYLVDAEFTITPTLRSGFVECRATFARVVAAECPTLPVIYKASNEKRRMAAGLALAKAVSTIARHQLAADRPHIVRLAAEQTGAFARARQAAIVAVAEQWAPPWSEWCWLVKSLHRYEHERGGLTKPREGAAGMLWPATDSRKPAMPTWWGVAVAAYERGRVGR